MMLNIHSNRPGLNPSITDQVTAYVTDQVSAQVALLCREPRSSKETMAELGLKPCKTFKSNYLLPLIEMGILERTIPDKPKSPLQRYQTTKAGLGILEEK